MKRCTKCLEEKPATEEFFGFDHRNRSRLLPRCKKCQSKDGHETYIRRYGAEVEARRIQKETYFNRIENLRKCIKCGIWQENTEKNFSKYKRSCRECGRKYAREKSALGRPKKSEKLKAENRRAERKKSLAKYNISFDQYQQAREMQNFKCAICGISEEILSYCGREIYLTIDHDHDCCKSSGSCGWCIRGLLCPNCNLLLGNAKEDVDILEKAIKYITDPPWIMTKIFRGETDAISLSS